MSMTMRGYLICCTVHRSWNGRGEILFGVALITLGIACNAMAGTVGGTDVRDFISGILMGLSIAEMLAGIVTIGKQYRK